MQVAMRDEKTIEITPENVAEHHLLEKFDGCKISVERPKPFDSNVVKLIVKRDA